MLPAFMVSTAIRPADGGADRLPPRAGGLTSGRIRSFALVATAALGLSTVSPARAQVTSVNGQIAYLACGPSSIPFFPDQCDVWVMNADGTGQTNLTHTTDSNEIGPAWSPGGTQIAFAASIPDPPLGVRADTDRQLYTAAMGDLEGMELTE